MLNQLHKVQFLIFKSEFGLPKQALIAFNIQLKFNKSVSEFLSITLSRFFCGRYIPPNISHLQVPPCETISVVDILVQKRD